MYLPPFFALRISNAAGSKPPAMIPSDTSILSSAAVEASTTPETATKSPNEHNGSAWRERRYAIAVGESSLPAASYTESISGSMGA